MQPDIILTNCPQAYSGGKEQGREVGQTLNAIQTRLKLP